jgi:hypothetical protein
MCLRINSPLYAVGFDALYSSVSMISNNSGKSTRELFRAVWSLGSFSTLKTSFVSSSSFQVARVCRLWPWYQNLSALDLHLYLQQVFAKCPPTRGLVVRIDPDVHDTVNLLEHGGEMVICQWRRHLFTTLAQSSRSSLVCVASWDDGKHDTFNRSATTRDLCSILSAETCVSWETETGQAV